MRAFYAVAAAFVLAGLVAPLSATVQAADLEALFRAEIEMAAHNLRMNPRDLDDSAGLALAASGASWKPTAGGMPLLRQDGRRVAYTGWAGRREGLGAARAAGDARTEFAFALSLVLDPAPDAALWRQAYGVVARYGDGLDAALIGTIGAEDRLPLLPSLRYAAADVMVWRADPRHTQFWLTLGESRDAYLVSRAVAAMGIICYAVHPVGSSRDGGSREQTTPSAMDGLLAPVREWPISAIQRRIFESAISKAATDRSYRVRAAAALALGLAGGPEARDLLVKLAKDTAYVVGPGAASGTRRVSFPVREAAAAGLHRFGVHIAASGGDFAPREFRQATRRGRDVTNDRSGVRSDLSSRVRFHTGAW